MSIKTSIRIFFNSHKTVKPIHIAAHKAVGGHKKVKFTTALAILKYSVSIKEMSYDLYTIEVLPSPTNAAFKVPTITKKVGKFLVKHSIVGKKGSFRCTRGGITLTEDERDAYADSIDNLGYAIGSHYEAKHHSAEKNFILLSRSHLLVRIFPGALYKVKS